MRLYITFGLILRIILMYSTPTQVSFSIVDVLRSLGIGLLSDFGVGTLLTIPIFVLYLGLNEWKYNKVVGYIIEGVLALGFFIRCGKIIFFLRIWRWSTTYSTTVFGLETCKFLYTTICSEMQNGMASHNNV